MHDELRFIWDNSPVGLAKVSRDGKFVAVSARFAEMVGYSETELLNRTFQQITHPDDVGPDTTEAGRLVDDSSLESYQMVKRYISKDGRTVWVNLHVFAIRDAKNEFIQFFVFVAELTPIGIVPNDSSHRQSTESKLTIWTYLKSNPKEATLIGSALLLLAKGKGLMEIVELIFKK